MVLYFTGTGNSRHAAQRIADALGDQLLSMSDRIKTEDTSPVKTDERLVIVTPTYAWRTPPPGGELAAPDGVFRDQAGVVCHDLRQRDRQCRQI